MKYLLDSDWIIDAKRGLATAVGAIESVRHEGIAISTVAIAEVYEGSYILDDPLKGIESFRQFLSGFATLEVTEPVAWWFAKTRAALRDEGNLIPDMDLLIAATALTHDLVLLTRNTRHFQRIPGLRLYDF